MEQEFDLSKAVSGQTKAMADRDFYMSMVAQNTPGASPLAAYLAGMASAKASQYEGQIQADKDARDAASKALKRQDALRDNFYQIMGDVSTGKMQPSAGAMMLAPLANEMGYRMVEYDADGGVATFADAEGEEYEVTMDQVPDAYKTRSEERKEEAHELSQKSKQRDIEYKETLLKNAKEKAQAEADKKVWDAFYKSNKRFFDADSRELGKEKYFSNEALKGFLKDFDSLPESIRDEHQGVADVITDILTNRGVYIQTPIKEEVTKTDGVTVFD